jgi:hypothetical protein
VAGEHPRERRIGGVRVLRGWRRTATALLGRVLEAEVLEDGRAGQRDVTPDAALPLVL